MPARESELDVGQVAIVEGSLDTNGTTGVATRVTVGIALAGPIAALDVSEWPQPQGTPGRAVPVVQVDGLRYAWRASIGAGNSQALLEALSSTRVLISVDPEGGGSFSAPVEWSWSALEALAD